MTTPEVPAHIYTLGTEPRTYPAPCMTLGTHMRTAAAPAQAGKGPLADTNVNTDKFGAGVERWARVPPYRSGPWVGTIQANDSDNVHSPQSLLRSERSGE